MRNNIFTVLALLFFMAFGTTTLEAKGSHSHHKSSHKEKSSKHHSHSKDKKSSKDKKKSKSHKQKSAKPYSHKSAKPSSHKSSKAKKVPQVPQVNISPNAEAHIKQRHWYKVNAGAPTSHFNKSMTVEKLNAIATKTLANGKTYDSAHGQGRKVHEYSFKKPIGTQTNGKKAHTLRVVTDGKKNVITAFPVK